jgi:RNA polymerase sigma factor (sigma-70 family)
VLALDEMLNRLAERSPRQGKIVELRYFGGLTEQEIADALGVSVRTVKSDWKSARTWVFAELSENPQDARRKRAETV